MKHSSSPRLARVTLASLLLALASPAWAGPAQPPPPAKPQANWWRDTVIRPTQPFIEIHGRNPDGWTFMLEPYAWAPGLYGTIGVGNLPSMTVDSSPIDVLQKLNWGVFARGEIRKGRWGLLADGFFAQFSASVEPTGPLYQSASARLQQSIDSAMLAYRVIDARNYYVDGYAGARLYYMGVSLAAEVEDNRLTRLGDALTDRSLPTGAEAERWWVDPVIGFRARVNLYGAFFLAAQADVGGFGAGSNIAFFTQASAGVNITRNLSAELGYRYMYVDYDRDNFLFRVNMPGIYGGLGVKF